MAVKRKALRVPVVAPKGQRKVFTPNPLVDMGEMACEARPADKPEALRLLRMAWLNEYTQHGTKQERGAALHLATRAAMAAGATDGEIDEQKRSAHQAAKMEPACCSSCAAGGPCGGHKDNPLRTGCSKEARQENIEREIEHGKPPRQAVAIAYEEQRREGCHTENPAPTKEESLAILRVMQGYKYGYTILVKDSQVAKLYGYVDQHEPTAKGERFMANLPSKQQFEAESEARFWGARK